jgi:hypothetical protein
VSAKNHGTRIHLYVNWVWLAAKESPHAFPTRGEMGFLDSPRRILGWCEGSPHEAYHEVSMRPHRDWASLADIGFLLRMEGTRWSKPKE